MMRIRISSLALYTESRSHLSTDVVEEKTNKFNMLLIQNIET